MCYHTGMPFRWHRTWHPTPSQYTDTRPTYHCDIYPLANAMWCPVANCYGTSHCITQLPTLMSWVRPNRGIFSRPSTHTREGSDPGMVITIGTSSVRHGNSREVKISLRQRVRERQWNIAVVFVIFLYKKRWATHHFHFVVYYNDNE